MVIHSFKLRHCPSFAVLCAAVKLVEPGGELGVLAF